MDEPTKPGLYLAYEREKKGFTIEDIAGKLYLSVHTIRALEEDAYALLPELVYVRGYIRSYCRVLGVDPNPVLDMYTANLPKEEDSLHEDLSLSSPIGERQQQLIMIWGSIAVVAIFLILVISWWQEKQTVTGLINEPRVLRDEATEKSIIGDSKVPDKPIKQDIIPTESASVTQEMTQPKPEVEIVPLEPIVPPILNPTEIDIREAVPTNNVSDEVLPSDLNTSADADFDNRFDDQVVDMPRPVTLAIMSDAESWARVRDGSGELIIHRILPAGYNKIFMVNLPLKFEFGNAYRVSIMIDGKDYDFSSRIRPSSAVTFEVTESP